jgi:hypothetical protein
VLSEVPEDGIRVGAELPIVLLIANESEKVWGESLSRARASLGCRYSAGGVAFTSSLIRSTGPFQL